jgi:hypothetical protein
MSRPLLLVLGLMAGSCVFSVLYMMRQGVQANELAASRDQLRFELAQSREQIQALSAKVDALNAVRPETPKLPESIPAPPPMPGPTRRHVAPKTSSARKPAEDPRWKQIRSQLAEQRDQITQTREDLQRTGENLEGKLNVARDELSGSIAKTHEDVVTLQKRGERNYYEFQIKRSKQFQRVGPVSLSLRKADNRHRYFDLAMMVNDEGLEKKHVNLYEPVWINLPDRPQPVELVVNLIEKDQVRGYLSEPKYRSAELGSTPPLASPQPTLKQR